MRSFSLGLPINKLYIAIQCRISGPWCILFVFQCYSWKMKQFFVENMGSQEFNSGFDRSRQDALPYWLILTLALQFPWLQAFPMLTYGCTNSHIFWEVSETDSASFKDWRLSLTFYGGSENWERDMNRLTGMFHFILHFLTGWLYIFLIEDVETPGWIPSLSHSLAFISLACLQ
jgi:hypothetical protein